MANILDRSVYNQQCCLFATVRREPRAAPRCYRRVAPLKKPRPAFKQFAIANYLHWCTLLLAIPTFSISSYRVHNKTTYRGRHLLLRRVYMAWRALHCCAGTLQMGLVYEQSAQCFRWFSVGSCRRIVRDYPSLGCVNEFTGVAVQRLMRCGRCVLATSTLARLE